MSFRRLISVSALAASAAVLPALPGQAAPSTGSCDGSYPTNATQLSLSVSSGTFDAGRRISTFGALRKNSCAIKGATVRIERKRVVNGTATGSWGLVRTVTTDRNGLYLSSTAPLHNELLRARFAAAGGFVPAVSSSVPINVRFAISEAVSKGAACQITVTGALNPAKAGHKVTIQTRGKPGFFHGWKTFATGTTSHNGHYTVTKTATCGKSYNLSALVLADATNQANRSRTIFGTKATS